MLQDAAVRFGRFLIAFLAVWCLGCNSFDTLAVAVTSGGMVSCSESSSSTSATHEAQPTISSQASTPSGVEQGCGCDHCVGTDIAAVSVRPVELPAPESFNLLQQFPAQVSREPAVPPPELRIAV